MMATFNGSAALPLQNRFQLTVTAYHSMKKRISLYDCHDHLNPLKFSLNTTVHACALSTAATDL